jgi:general secretion pathway protein D
MSAQAPQPAKPAPNADAGATNAAADTNAPAANVPVAATNAGATNVAISATNFDARRRALLFAATNRSPQFNTNAPAFPVLPSPPSPRANIATAPTTNAAPAANVAGQIGPPAPGNPAAVTAANPADAAPDELQEHYLKFYNAPVDQIFEKYSELTGRTVLRPASLTGNITIINYTPLTRSEAIQALDGALGLNKVTMVPQGEKFVKAVPDTQAPQEGGSFSKYKDGEFPDSEQWVTHIVQLKIAKPTELAQVLSFFTKNPAGIVPIDSNQILVIRDFASNVKRMVELIAQVDVAPDSEYKLEVIPIKYGKVTDLFDTMNQLVSGGGGAGGVTSGTRSSAAQRRPGQLPTTGGAFGSGASSSRFGNTGRQGAYGAGAGQYGQPQANQPIASLGGVQQGAAGGASFQDRLRQIVNRAAGSSEVQLLTDARIVPNEQSNSLIVYANREDMKQITNIVSKIDVLLAQVLIEGIVLSVDLKDEYNLGVSWLQKPKDFSNGNIGAGGINNGPSFLSSLTNVSSFGSSLPSGFSYFGKLGQNYDVSIAALATDSRARILQRPRIQTSHATPGVFFNGSTVPYVTGFYDYGGYGGSAGLSTRSQVEQIQVGVQLQVTPFITPDGLVVMDIDQDISSIESFVTIDNNQVPTTSSRHATATLSVHDGETILLGGYIEDSRTSGKSGVPVLKDIPLLGALFRSKNNNKDRKELLLLMHVSVLKSPLDASNQVANEKAKLPGISEADKEFKKTEEQSLKKAGLPPLQ